MFDTHCHLNLDPLFDEHEKVIKSAREAGVSHMLLPSTNWENAKRALEIVENFQNVYMSVGVHPTEKLESISIDSLATRINDIVAANVKVVAIGEIGLDYYHTTKRLDVSGPAVQKEFFDAQLRIALKLDLPVIIHNRLSTDDMLAVLNSIGASNFSGKAVFHCCPPEKKLLEFAKKNTIYIGVDGDITYDKEKQQFIKHIPEELLLLETDSPYLTPEPARSETRFPNNPGNLSYVLDMISEIKGKDMRLITFNNSLKLFSLEE